jgi:murein DD-endopeptidase MepM/ murein hydrolase activator NlpD
MKKKKSYSVIIVSDALTKNKGFSISSSLLRNSIIGIVILLFSFGYIIFDYLTISFDKQEFKVLKKKLADQEKDISELTAILKETKKNLVEADYEKKKILVALGLSTPNALKETHIGRGGSTIINQGSNLANDNLRIPAKVPKQHYLQDARIALKDSQALTNMLKRARSFQSDRAVQLASYPSIMPTNGYLTDTFGYRKNPITGKRQFHYGQDIATQLGNKVVATANGYVLMAERQRALGKLIVIDHNFGYTTRYGHLASFAVKEGDTVKRGQVIGYVGSTGSSTAPHLHYEVRFQDKAINPLKFIFD